MKKVLIISSSPRRGGNSDTLADQFLAGAKEAGHDVEKIFLKDHTINYCTGCGVCVETSKCPQKDDMAPLLEKMIAADVIVFATPVYFYTMCGQLKTFIDRLCARYLEMSNKEFYYLLAAAETDQASMKPTIVAFGGLLDCIENPTYKGTVYALGVWKVGEIEGHPSLKEAYEVGKSV